MYLFRRANLSALGLLFVIFAIFTGGTRAQQQEIKLPEGVEKTASLGGINEYRLANGLQILLFPDQSKPNTTVNIVYKVGSRHENYGETGMAHLLEHLLFKGTPKYPNLMAELTKRVSRTNATTYLDRTFYFESFPASEETLRFALDLEADRMINSFIAKKDLESEFSVVRNELERNDNSPLSALRQKVTAAAYEWHNYGNAPIGVRPDIENVRIENLQAFYRKYYQPDNAVLIIAGNLDEQKTLEIIKEKFGSIARPTRELPKFWTVEPAQEGEQRVILRRIGETPILMAGYHVAPVAHEDSAALAVAANILTEAPSGRLYKALVETKKAATVNASPMLSNRDPGLQILVANLSKNASLDETREVFLNTIENLSSQPPTAEEVERAKASVLKPLERSFADSNRLALDLSEWVANGDWKLIFLYRDRLKAVTPADVQRVAGKYFVQTNRTVGEFVPTDKNPVRAQTPLVSDEEIAAMTKNLKSDSAIAAGEFFDATPANIEARVKRSSIGGLKTAFLSKQNRGETVNAVVHLRFGDSESLRNRGFAGAMTARMLMRGTISRSRQQIQDELNRLKASINPTGGDDFGRMFISANRKTLPEVLRLVGDMLKNPAFSPEEFELLKQEYIAAMQRQIGEPGSIATREIERLTYPYPKGAVHHTVTLEETIEDIKRMTLDDVKKFYADFYGASAGEFVVVGDFDEAEISKTANEIFAGWKSRKPYRRVPEEFFNVAPTQKTIETPGKSNAYFIARLILKMKDTDADYPAFVLANYMIGGGFLNSRLANRIRQKEGISYTVGSTFRASSRDEIAELTANAIYAPQNLERLEKAFQEEIQKIASEGFTEEEVAQAKQGWLLGRQRLWGRDLDLTVALQENTSIDRTFAWEQDLEKKVLALTTAQINAAMKKYLNLDKISIVKAGDFARVGSK
jgi:zinc protease